MTRTRTKVRPPLQGHLIVFEGRDEARRTKLAATIAEALKSAQVLHRLVSLCQRDPGSLSQHIADLHRDPSAFGISAFPLAAGQALGLAARIDVIERAVLPALGAGEQVILDDGPWASADLLPTCRAGVADALIEVERRLWRDQPTILFIIEGHTTAREAEHETHWGRLLGQMSAHSRIREMRGVIVRVGKGLRTGRVIDVVLRTLVMHKVIKASMLQRRAENTANTDRQLSIAFGAEDLAKSALQAAAPPTVFARMSGPRSTVVFDTYWRFAAERQHVFYRRFEGKLLPWTSDPILIAHKFTNAYRASDRVSQFLIKHVIYRPDLPQSVHEVCFRILLFKLFNKIETWRLLEDHLGAVVHEDYAYKRYDQILSRALGAGRRIYSAAYIMPPGSRAFGQKAKHQNHLRLLEMMMRAQVPAKLAGMHRMQDAFELLRSFPTIGNFLAYQLVTDINYSTVTDFSETEFVMPGPGALDGIRKCFSSLGDLSEPDIIRLMTDEQSKQFARLGLDFRSLFGRPLQLIDCQNLFCEVDKYARVAHPEFVGLTGRSRIKQKFAPILEPIEFWYPPKWGLNEEVEKFGGGQSRNGADDPVSCRSKVLS